VLDQLEAAAAPGMSTWELDQIAHKRLKQLKADSAFLGYRGYPAVLCTSVNDVIVHGIPARTWCSRTGTSSPSTSAPSRRLVRRLGPDHPHREGQPRGQKLMEATRQSLDAAIAQCVPGKRLGDIGWAVQSLVEAQGYSVVRSSWGTASAGRCTRSLTSPNYGDAGRGTRLAAGLVVAIEPMVNMGSPEVVIEDDGWTAVTKDGSLSAHFEHSVAITDNGPFVLSRA
jgi:methionyl aminopeptidase